MELVLATRNPHKLRELRELLKPHVLVRMPDDLELPAEEGEDFADNARAKARAVADSLAKPSVADDSGLVVPALEGKPGVSSARYAGPHATDEDNLEKLLAQCRELDDRNAFYVCALAIAWPDGGEELFEGRCEGWIVLQPRGERGFGYDPVFVPLDGDGDRTMAELSQEEKDAISHRGVAARALCGWLCRASST